MGSQDRITFAWWNLHDHAHHDLARVGRARWPQALVDYEAKRDRVVAALATLSAGDFPDLIAVCEITREAATDLASRLTDAFEVAPSPVFSYDDDFQVAVFYRRGIGLAPQVPVTASDRDDVSRGTRPMPAIHLTLPGHVLRFVACHWPGMGEESSHLSRIRLADILRRDSYLFLHPDAPKHEVNRHLVILGDLNEEPTDELFCNHLGGERDRRSSRVRRHWRDKDVKRIRLYNLAWRYLGEQTPHAAGLPLVGETAGTYYSEKTDWRTFNHVLVSGSLLGNEPPYLDEEQTRIINRAMMQDHRGLPGAFRPGQPSGISDHLPIVGQIILPGNPE